MVAPANKGSDPKSVDLAAGNAMVLHLDAKATGNAELVGKKGATLANLTRDGFPVPPAFCVTTVAFREFVRINGITLPEHAHDKNPQGAEKSAEAVRERFLNAELPQALVEHINTAYSRLFSGDEAGGAVAVRSSATAEDLAGASFAGQYETLLGVRGQEKLLEALKHCWASLHGATATAYRLEHGIDATEISMAVVVQRLIDAEVAGVVFTRDPVTGDDTVIVNASWGLGEAVVSGLVTPDLYRLTKDGALVDHTIATKHVQAVPEGSEAVDEQRASMQCLSEDQLAELVDLAVRVEQAMGCPQDLEFAHAGGNFWLLQARPITTEETQKRRRPRKAAQRIDQAAAAESPPCPEPLLERGMEPRPNDHWTRVIADEYYADAVTPFSFSALGPWIDRDTTKAMDRIMGFLEIDENRPTLRLFKSHIYWNADTVAKGFKSVPKSARVDALLAYFPPEMRPRVAEVSTAWFKRLKGELLMRLRDRNSSFRRNHHALEIHAKRVDAACAELDRIDLSQAGRDQVMSYWRTIDDLGRAHFEVIRWGLQQHSLTFNFALAKLLTSWLNDNGRLLGTLIGSAETNLTLETNQDIWQLARQAERNEVVLKLLKDAPMPAVSVGDNPPSPLFNELSRLKGAEELTDGVRRFLERHGHRSFTRDIGLPRWSDQPDAVLGLIAQAMGSKENPELRAKRERAESVATKRRVRSRLNTGTLGRARVLLFDFLQHYARIYTAFRENQRFTLDKILQRARRAALAYGRLLADKGLLGSPGEVFFLTVYEVHSTLDGDIGDAEGLARARRDAFERDSHSMPSPYLHGDTAMTEDREDESEAALAGMSVSAGRITARCRVVRDLSEAGKLEAGEILVTSNTDPGWTPLFMKIGGLVLETGGMLAHGAIVAREYGVPAVTAVEAATQRIRDGEWITVDGWAGQVECHGESPPKATGSGSSSTKET